MQKLIHCLVIRDACPDVKVLRPLLGCLAVRDFFPDHPSNELGEDAVADEEALFGDAQVVVLDGEHLEIE